MCYRSSKLCYISINRKIAHLVILYLIMKGSWQPQGYAQYPGQYPSQSTGGVQSQMGSITGKWQAHLVDGVKVNFPVEIDSNSISFKYCNIKSFSYIIQGSSIKVQPGLSTLMACLSPMKPTEDEVTDAFQFVDNFELSSHSLVLKKGNNPLVVLVRL